jgi:hypothetical protein
MLRPSRAFVWPLLAAITGACGGRVRIEQSSAASAQGGAESVGGAVGIVGVAGFGGTPSASRGGTSGEGDLSDGGALIAGTGAVPQGGFVGLQGASGNSVGGASGSAAGGVSGNSAGGISGNSAGGASGSAGLAGSAGAASCGTLSTAFNAGCPVKYGHATAFSPCNVYEGVIQSGILVATPVALSAGTVTALGLISTQSGVVTMALYSSNESGAPLSRLVQTASSDITSGPNELLIPPTPVSNATYWIAVEIEASIIICAEISSGAPIDFGSEPYGTFPLNWVPTNTVVGGQYNFYVVDVLN